jgi:hypothetical protein
MMLSTTHDFYLGRGPDAEWLGSLQLGTCARGTVNFVVCVAGMIEGLLLG